MSTKNKTIVISLGITIAVILTLTGGVAIASSDKDNAAHNSPIGRQAQVVTKTIRVEALIDGRSQLILRANTAQWHHFDFAAPGRHLFVNVPTVINGVDWFPDWPDIPNKENRDCNCFSDVFNGVVPPLPQTNTQITFRTIQSRHITHIVQLPTASNNYTLIIEFDDNPVGGDDNYIVEIDFTIVVDIDIKPGSAPNSVNCNNTNGVLAVAILTTKDFEATTVDHTTVNFEGASETHVVKKSGEARRHEKDVDGDGDTDLVFHFRLGDTSLTCDSTEGMLIGETFDGQAIGGTDAVRMINRGGGKP